jgi:hypothetical protein
MTRECRFRPSVRTRWTSAGRTRERPMAVQCALLRRFPRHRAKRATSAPRRQVEPARLRHASARGPIPVGAGVGRSQRERLLRCWAFQSARAATPFGNWRGPGQGRLGLARTLVFRGKAGAPRGADRRQTPVELAGRVAEGRCAKYGAPTTMPSEVALAGHLICFAGVGAWAFGASFGPVYWTPACLWGPGSLRR